MKILTTPIASTASLVSAFLLNLITNSTLYNAIMLARKGFGHGGGASFGSGATKAKALIVVIILVLIIPFISLLFSGATTGSTGLYGNATISANVRNSTASFSNFIVIILVLGALGIVLSLL